PPRPAALPTRLATARRQETLLAHPAVQAWRRLNPDRVVPERITPAKFKANKTRSHLTVYRLQGVGPEGEAVIAKRCDRGEGLVERAVYERVLPHVSLPGPHFYGAVEDQDVCWLFIREVQGEKYDVDRPDHRAAAAQWLGLLHTEAPSVARRAGLPDAGPGRYRDQMRATRDAVRNHLDNPAFGNGDLAFLDRLLEQFEDLDAHWGRLERDCSGLPPTLIHGDFNGKNLRIQTAPSDRNGRAARRRWRASPDDRPADRVPVQAALRRGPCKHLPEDHAGARRRRRGGRCHRCQRTPHRPLDGTGGARPVRAEADLRDLDESGGSPACAGRCHRESISRDGRDPRQGDCRAHSRGCGGPDARHVRRFATRSVDAAAGCGTARRQAIRRHVRVRCARRPERGRAVRRAARRAQASAHPRTALSPARRA